VRGALLVAALLVHGPTLGPGAIAGVSLGTTEPHAVAALSVVFGRPSARGVNTGCGPRYTEVEWGDLIAEFRLGRLSGFRYVVGGYPLTTPGSPHAAAPRRVRPLLATARGITLGSTIVQVRAAYGALHLARVGAWRARDGLVFVESSSHRIVEIAAGTCGDF